MGSDLSVINAARVSFDKQSDWEYEQVSSEDEWLSIADDSWMAFDSSGRNLYRLSEKDRKLITYLAKHKHKLSCQGSYLRS